MIRSGSRHEEGRIAPKPRRALGMRRASIDLEHLKQGLTRAEVVCERDATAGSQEIGEASGWELGARVEYQEGVGGLESPDVQPLGDDERKRPAASGLSQL